MIDLTKSPAQLKASILQDAMMGKLTQQLPEDGDAKDLLAQINAEKDKLIKAKKIKKQKALPEIDDDEIPFEIPDNWKWVRLGEIANLVIGKTPSRHNSEYWNGNIPWVSVRDMNNGLLTNTNEGITNKAEIDKFNNNIIPKGTMLMSFKLSIGKVCILGIPAYHNEAIVSFNFYKYPDTIQNYLFRTIHFLTRFAKSKNAIQGKTLNKTSLNNMLIPFPPLSEQKRIIQKLDSLLPKVDEFNHSVEQLHNLREELPSRLRRSFLQSAMMGQLTKQLTEDGDASDLLEQIKAEKETLIKAKKIKAQKPLPEIDADEIPFEIPDNWRWVRLGEISTFPQQKSINAKDIDDSTWVLDLKEIEKNTGKLISKETNSQKKVKSSKVIFHKNDVLYNKLRPYLNKVLVANEDGVATSELFVIHLLANVSPQYLSLALRSPYFIKKVNDDTYGTKMPRAGTKNVIKYLIPLPPLSEQKRIVNKLDKLLDELKG